MDSCTFLSYISCCDAQISDLRKEWSIRFLVKGNIVHPGGEGGLSEIVGYIVFTVRNQRVMNTPVLLTFSFMFSGTRPQPMELFICI